MKAPLYFLTCLGLGVVAALGRLVYLFFPFLNVMDVVVFGSLAAFVAWHRPRRWWLWVLVLIVPVMGTLARILSRSTIEGLWQGVGTGHLLGAVLIPVAAFGAGALAARIRPRPTAPPVA